MSSRSLTVLAVPANTPDEIDALGWAARREQGGGWTRVELLHPGAPDVLLRRALELDQGVYGSARAWDDDERAVVETSTIMAGDVEDAASLLAPHTADPLALARVLVEEADSNEDPRRVARALVEPLAEPAAGPAEEAATYVRIFLAHVSVAVPRGMGLAWELRTPAPCGCAVWDGTTLGNIRSFPRSQFVTLASEERDGARHGRLRCMRCRATFAFVARATHADVTREPRAATIELGPDEIDRVVAGIRDGSEAMIGGSRCHTTYRGRDGALFVEDFDEGHTDERPCSEAELRATIARSPGEFLEVLRAPLREVLHRALVGASQESPHEALHDLLVYGECLSHRHLLEELIDWGSETPMLTPEAKAELAQIRDGLDVYHFIRSAVGYGANTPATGRFGMRVYAVLAEMLGRELPRWRRYRADFRVMAGDPEGALADLEWEREQLPADDVDRPYLARAIARLVDARLLAQIAATPDDDAPRLVWADILTERGDPRGELIVAQCRLLQLDEHDAERAALLSRAFHLVALHGRSWGKRGYAYDRGFVQSTEVRIVTFTADLDDAFALSPPVQGVRFRTYRGDAMEDPARVLDDPRLERLTAIDFTKPVFAIDGPDGEAFHPFGSQVVRRLEGRLPQLRELKLRGTELTVEDVGRIGPRPALRTLDLGQVPLRGATGALFGSGGFDALHTLRLDQCELGDDDLAPIATLPALEKLDLDGNPVGDRGAHLLANLRLKELRLEGAAIGDEGAAALAAARDLRLLGLAKTRVGNAGVAALADLELRCLLLESAFDGTGLRALREGRIARTLQRLHLGPSSEPPLGGEAVRLLAGMPRLWQLLLHGCAVGGDDAMVLLDGLPSLRALAIGRAMLDDAALARIVAHPAFARLDALEVGHNQLGPEAGAILARAPRLPPRLFLNGNRLGDAGARALAEAPVAARVADLILQDNGITEEGALALVGESSQLVASVGKLCLHDNAIGAAAAVCTEKLGPRFCF